MKFSTRLTAALLALLLCLSAAGCTKRQESAGIPPATETEQETTEENTAESTEESVVEERPKLEIPTSYATVEEMQETFDAFILEEFVTSLEGDYLAIHQTLLHPEEYGIDSSKAEVTVGTVTNEEHIQETLTENLRLKEQFETFDYELLTEEQQETYLVYEYLLNQALESCQGDYPYMTWEFAPMQGVQSAIPSLLLEYDFYTIEDVDAYVEMLSDIGRYVEEALEYTKTQARKGYMMSNAAIDTVLDYCEKTIEAGRDSTLRTTIRSKMENCDLLTDEQKEEYIQKVTDIFYESILYSYHEIYDTLKDMRDESNNQLGLCYLENGKEYYEYLFRSKSGSDRSVAEAKALLQDYLNIAVTTITDISASNPELYRQYTYEGISIDYDSLGDMMLDLEQTIWQSFPYIDSVDYSIAYLDPDVAVDGISAYYVVPPLDSSVVQKIKVSPDADLEETSPSTFMVMAHEGLPGHMYQTNYVRQNVENPFRQNVSISGYSEGWATYVELVSLNFLDLPTDMITLEQSYSIYEHCLIALCDIGVHYDGWTVSEMQNFLNQYTTMDSSAVRAIYNQLLGDPAAFQSYYMGCVEFLELRRQAQNTLGGRFNEIEFHQLLLEGGEVPFSVLQMKVENYIQSKKS